MSGNGTGRVEVPADTPTVSVVMSAYNGRRYVAEAVRSILGQEYGDFELVAIDDGSSDGTGELLEEYARRDGRVRVTRQANAGLTVSLNRGLAAARGRYIARMDDDDVSLPERLGRQVGYLEVHAECVAVGTRVLVIDAEGDPVWEMGLLTEHEELVAAMLGGRGQMMFHSSMMFRREALERVGGYRERFRYAQDLDLFLRLAEVGRLANLPEVLVKYREHPLKVGTRHDGDQKRAVAAILAEACERRGLPAPELNGLVEGAGGSAADRHRKFAWWALRGGNVGTARKHALRSLARAPLSGKAWRALACAVRGR